MPGGQSAKNVVAGWFGRSGQAAMQRADKVLCLGGRVQKMWLQDSGLGGVGTPQCRERTSWRNIWLAEFIKRDCRILFGEV
jgi:hypothetical protein